MKVTNFNHHFKLFYDLYTYFIVNLINLLSHIFCWFVKSMLLVAMILSQVLLSIGYHRARYQLPSKLFSSIIDGSIIQNTDVNEQGGSKTFRVKRLTKRRDGTGKPKGYFDSRYVLERCQNSGLVQLDPQKPFLVLGIESSCDDTGVAVVSSDGKVLSNVVYSQYEIHEKFGGVVPALAIEAHKANIDKAIQGALSQAGLSSVAEVDAIAVTKGPGLEVCLRVGLRKAQVCTCLMLQKILLYFPDIGQQVNNRYNICMCYVR